MYYTMNIDVHFVHRTKYSVHVYDDCTSLIIARPLINHKLEDKVCGNGPSLDIIFRDDTHLLKLGQDVTDCIGRGFDVARDWASKFELYQMFYNENEALDLVQLEKDDHGQQELFFTTVFFFMNYSHNLLLIF